MNKRTLVLLAVAAVFILACSCPLTNLVSSISPDVGDMIVDSIPEEALESIPTEYAEQADEMMESLGEIDSMEDLNELMDSEVPENVPLIEPRNDDLTAMMGAISYTTPLSYDEVTAFYETQLPLNGWVLEEDSMFKTENPKTALYTFKTDEQTLNLTISEQDASVVVGMWVQ